MGCIPKKLMHQTAMLSVAMQDARKFGWEFDETGKGSEYVQNRGGGSPAAVASLISSLMSYGCLPVSVLSETQLGDDEDGSE